MKKIELGKTGLLVSKVAMGGIPIMRLGRKEAVGVVKKVLDLGVNFIDTANGYADSEEKIGKALRGRKREEVIIASKSGASDKKTLLKHLSLSLKRMGLDYIDIYQLHGVNSEERRRQVMAPGGAYEGLKETIEKGRVKHAGFSSHSMDETKKLILTGKFEVVQIPFNFIDTEPEKEIIPLARKKNLGIIAMKPLGGGLLSNARLCFRYLAQFPDIIPDPGIERIEEMKEILQVAGESRPLSDQEKKEIEKIREELGKEYCRRCDYCQPCSEDIPISSVLVLKGLLKRMPLESLIEWIDPAIEKAKRCTECEECVERCPYNLLIPQLLKGSIAIWKEEKNKAQSLRR